MSHSLRSELYGKLLTIRQVLFVLFVRPPDSVILRMALFINMVLERIAAPVLVRNL